MSSLRINECIKWLWAASDGFRLSVVWCALTGALNVSVSLCFVFVCKHLIDIATGISNDSLGAYIGWMAICLTAQLVLSVIRSRLTTRTEVKLRNGLHNRLFEHLMKSQWNGRETFHSGDLLNRIEADTASVTDTVCRTVPTVVVTIVQLGGALYFLSRLDMRLTGILVFIMPLAILFSKSYVRKMRRMSREIRETDSRIQSHMQENLQHRIIVRTLEYTRQAVKKLGTLQTSLQGQVYRRTDFSAFSRSMVQIGFMTGYAVAFLWGVFGLRDGTVTFGMMAAFLQLVSQIQRPMVDMSRQIPVFIRVFTATERLAELTSLPLERQGKSVRLTGNLGIRISHVRFSYPDSGREVLAGFSHDFRPGSLTAIVGETGVGKSTLIKLILALVQPKEGNIVIYNEQEEVTASPQTRCNLSYVPQGNTLFSGTIRDNLLIGNPNATEADMRSALHTAVADFVFSLPGGLDTACGEQGTGLSEGQAQRIAIARGLLRPGNILLLDEPSSALDSQTEEELLKRLTAGIRGKTVVLITHRERIAGLCSKVVRMKEYRLEFK
ncbi:ABC transporter ATP-binding protein [Phocaeicola barnesiae]|uniref:ABC transporter ATP-binding protein n=1 Tax=Phocaeicola barnesiae TaxID=376804 RepID=UPI0025A496BE|nr:ABC transporter ATP-binding protein [Phocaeicola barnesiae]MDM8234393.1 ABC transporter ATP-binding protein [Phocaeicola barnesiae]